MSDTITLRENSQETIQFTLEVDDVAYVLTTEEVKMKREDRNGRRDVISTADASPILSIIAGGKLELDPTDTTWGGGTAGWEYQIFFSVETSSNVWISFPEDDNIKVTIIPWG